MFLKSPIEQFNLIMIGHICSGISNLSIFFVIIISVLSFITFLIVKNFNNKLNNFNIENFILETNIEEDDIIVESNSTMISFIPTGVQFLIENLVYEFVNAFKKFIKYK